MTSTLNADERATLVETLAALRTEVAALSDRVAKLEAGGLARGAEARAAAPPESQHPSPIGVTPDIIAAITAALAAYLGVKPHIRQITMLSGAAWAQQGRVTIQASHSLTIPRD